MFAHGAGEVGYMAGPLATIWEVNQTGKLPKNVVAPYWILFIAAFSLVAGLATYGKKITKAVGTQFCKITPARGFAAELSTAVVIMVASQFGLPTSSSQCITGGIVGVGMVEGMGGVNWKFFAKTFASWVATLFVMGVGTGLLFTQGHTAP
jgi:sodium-dependent phosphate transporter